MFRPRDSSRLLVLVVVILRTEGKKGEGKKGESVSRRVGGEKPAEYMV